MKSGRQHIVLLAGLIGISLPTVAHAERQKMRFDDGWKFHLQDETIGEPAPLASAGSPVGPWRWKTTSNALGEVAEVTRPDFRPGAEWKDAVPGQNMLSKENSFGWFRAMLPGTAQAPVLHFESVDDNATVYLNGQKLTEHSGWDDPFDVNLAPTWKAGGPNVITVLVENVGGSGGMGAAALRTESVAPIPSVASGPASGNYRDAGWRDVHLPHDFIVEGHFDPKADASHGFLPKAAGWYRKTFVLPKGDKGKTLWLEFDGVYRNSIVWLNGRQLGKHASGYTSFYYDVSEAANYGGPNTLAVFADARQNEGWWYEGGGIYRHVYLTRLAPLHIAHWGTYVAATPSSDLQSADIAVETALANAGSAPANCSIETRVMSPSGKSVARVQVDGVLLRAGQEATTRPRLRIGNPQLWSPDTPFLYTLVTTIRQGKTVVDEERTTFGIRSLHWDAQRGFFLNGKPFKIQGTCNHQDFAGIGVALPDRVHSYKVERLKEMGSNAFRFSHNPMAPELLDACDRLGMVVMDENRKLGDSPEILGQVESLVRRDRNHPSVIMWSMCNEEPLQGSERGAQMFKAMKDVVAKWDSTRPVTAAMNGGYGNGISLVTDLQGFNYHTGDYDAVRQKLPHVPMYGSETASEVSTRGVYALNKFDRYFGLPEKGYVSAYSLNAPPWAQTSEVAWRALAEREWMAGGFVWTGFDYRGEPTPFQWPVVNSHFGVLDVCGFPKDAYYYYQSWWGKAPVAHIFPHWSWPGKENEVIPVWVHGNAAQYELFLNGQSLGTKPMPRNSHLEWPVKYAPGTLETRGYDASGKVVVSDRVQTSGTTAKIQLMPDRTQILADGEDVSIVRVAILDAQNRVVPTADNEVVFSVSGAGQIVGVANGDPSSHEPDKASRRHAFNGYCMVIVQNNGKNGSATLRATSPGLQGAAIKLEAGNAPRRAKGRLDAGLPDRMDLVHR